MRSLSVFGTTSDAGKSTISFVIAKLLQNRGYKVAPFKAQNVSNNSRVTSVGGELAIAQYFQAEVLGIEPSPEMNPVLLKSGSGNGALMVINGKAVGDRDVRDYYRNLDSLKPIVKDSLFKLIDNYDIVVCEGAGSPVELNLMDKDLSNIYTAEVSGNDIVLVADIERGGSFASIWGTINLLPNNIRENLIGVIVNKFRGDITLFDKGIDIIENRFNIPVIGVVPYIPFNLGFEDSQSLFNYRQKDNSGRIRVAIIKLPHISNFNDFEPLIIDEEVQVEFTESGIDGADILIIPGSKRTIYDLKWLKNTGIFDKVNNFKGVILGVCGGYQMMFDSINDLAMIESDSPEIINGFGFINSEITFNRDKVLVQKEYEQFGCTVNGFEIHNGVSEIEWFDNGRIKGTFLHGIFENDNFRKKLFTQLDKKYLGYEFLERRKYLVDDFVSECEGVLNIDLIEQSLNR